MNDFRRPINPLAIILLLSAVFFVVFLSISGVFYLSKGSHGISHLGSGRLVGIVEINGVIMDSKKTLARLEQMEEDDRVKAVVVRLNSPGGSVAPSQEIYQAVKNFKKPILASMSSVAASGAYYVACGAQKIFANPGTLTGSIGVIMEFANLQKLYEWAKVQRFAIKTGKFKSVGAEYREMTPEEHTLLQTMVDDVLVQFKKAVAEGRHLSMAAVDHVADGRIFSGQQAKEAHLVDEMGTLQDAVDEAGRLGKIKGKPEVIYPEKKKKSILDFIMDDSPSDESTVGLSPVRGGVLNRLYSLVEKIVQGSAGGAGDQDLEFVPGLYWLWR